VNPEPGEESISLEDVGLDGPQVRHRKGCVVKTFSQWIQNEPKEKWCLMFDEGEARHGRKTTNFVEVYNCVLRGARPLPLVGIIKFFMYRTISYFHTRCKIADEVLRNTQMRYCTRMIEYLTKAPKHLNTRSQRSLGTSLMPMKLCGAMRLSVKGKCVLALPVKRRIKLLNLATKYADVHAGSHSYYTSPAHM
jgi:hypothetical protein